MIALIYQDLQENPANLRFVTMALGLALVLGHGWALAKSETALKLAQAFPRNEAAGKILLILAALWSWLLLRGVSLGSFEIEPMVLGELSRVRTFLFWIIPVGAVLMMTLAKEFLAVRALGCVMLLSASLLLDLAWMHHDIHPTHILIPLYCYAILIIPALFFIGQPWRLRDLLSLFGRKPRLWQFALIAGFAFGLLLTISSALWWKL